MGYPILPLLQQLGRRNPEVAAWLPPSSGGGPCAARSYEARRPPVPQVLAVTGGACVTFS